MERLKVKMTDLENLSPMELLYPADPDWLAGYFDSMADLSAQMRRDSEYREDRDQLRVFGHFARSIASRLRAMVVVEECFRSVHVQELYEVCQSDEWEVCEQTRIELDDQGNVLTVDVTAEVALRGEDDMPPEMWPPGAS